MKTSVSQQSQKPARPGGGSAALKPLRLLKRYCLITSAIALALGATLIGCGGGGKQPIHRSNAISVFVSGQDVYVAGRSYDPSQDKQVATVWKNGAPQYLATQHGTSIATSVFVSGEDVHVVGNQEDEFYYSCPAYWKNGILQQLPDGTGYSGASSVFVSGEDVYIAGRFKGNAILLKNGVQQPMDFSDSESSGMSVYVANGDVYVAGNRLEQGRSIATLWKNGAAQNLNENFATVIRNSFAASVSVSGEDVYVAGYVGAGTDTGCYPVLWINGTPRYLQLQASVFYRPASSVFVSGGDVYVTGFEGGQTLEDPMNVARLWKNGVAQELK